MRNIHISYMERQLSNVVPVGFQPTNEIPRSVREEHCTQVRIQLRVRLCAYGASKGRRTWRRWPSGGVGHMEYGSVLARVDWWLRRPGMSTGGDRRVTKYVPSHGRCKERWGCMHVALAVHTCEKRIKNGRLGLRFLRQIRIVFLRQIRRASNLSTLYVLIISLVHQMKILKL
jgi:hypothetical protein